VRALNAVRRSGAPNTTLASYKLNSQLEYFSPVGISTCRPEKGSMLISVLADPVQNEPDPDPT
jgi:hypothetical protein